VRRVAKCGVKGRNINASVLHEDERNQKGIHNPRKGRPKGPREMKEMKA